jgi:hypothetical protein
VSIIRVFLEPLQHNASYDQDNRQQRDYQDRIKNVFTHDNRRFILTTTQNLKDHDCQSSGLATAKQIN